MNPDVGATEGVDSGELELGRWGLRFARAETETDYLKWHVQRSIPFKRMGMLASIFNWVAATVGVRFAVPDKASSFAIWTMLVMTPLCIMSIALTYRPRLRRWIFPSTIFVNSLTGCSLVALSFLLLEMPDAAMAATVIVAFFGFTVFRLGPLQATVTVLPYIVLNQVLLLHWHGESRLALAPLVVYSVAGFVAFMSGLIACVVIDRLSRESYRQQRTIESQQRVLELERARSERLLLNVLPEAIAQRLKTERTIAEYFPEATVLFGDIAGFTTLSSKMSPEALVKILDEIFSAFDDIADKHGLEKIKTVGDAYMVAGGLPTPRADHVEAVAAMALDMRDLFQTRKFAPDQALSLRIGIHTGPVVAGVIGKKKFIYDLWGDTVNVASRMESHGVEGRVQVTEATFEKLRRAFTLSARGAVQVKGKGEMQTWFLDSRGAPPA